jgi:hypothetical protein
MNEADDTPPIPLPTYPCIAWAQYSLSLKHHDLHSITYSHTSMVTGLFSQLLHLPAQDEIQRVPKCLGLFFFTS